MSLVTKAGETGFRYPYVIGWTGDVESWAFFLKKPGLVSGRPAAGSKQPRR